MPEVQFDTYSYLIYFFSNTTSQISLGQTSVNNMMELTNKTKNTCIQYLTLTKQMT